MPRTPGLAALLLAAWLGAPAAAAQGRPAGGAVVAEPARPGPAAAPPAPGAGPTVEYAYDDGGGNSNIGPPSSFDPDMLWGNYYFTTPGGEEITEVAVAFGPTFPSRTTGPVTFWLLDDPDADGDPRNATAVASADATPDVSGNAFYRVALPPTRVGAAFFVGASAQLLGGQDRPARVDTGARADRSWFFYAPDIAAVIDSLAGAPFGTRMDDASNVPFPGAFMVRATGQPFVPTGAADGPAEGAVALGAVVPNPARGAAAVRFALAEGGRVRVAVYDVLGREVAVLVDGERPAGRHAAELGGGGLPPGAYLVRLDAGGATRVRRVTVAR